MPLPMPTMPAIITPAMTLHYYVSDLLRQIARSFVHLYFFYAKGSELNDKSRFFLSWLEREVPYQKESIITAIVSTVLIARPTNSPLIPSAKPIKAKEPSSPKATMKRKIDKPEKPRPVPRRQRMPVLRSCGLQPQLQSGGGFPFQ